MKECERKSAGSKITFAYTYVAQPLFLLFNLIIQAIYITFFKAIGVKIVVAITTMTIGGNMAASIKPIA